MTNRWRRGFSMIELAVVVAILVVLAAVTYPLYSSAKRNAELRRSCRMLLENLSIARSLAAKGAVNSAWNPTDRTLGAGVRILSGGRQYAVFIDRDGETDGDEVDVSVLDLDDGDPTSRVLITSPTAPAEIRFRANGVLSTSAQIDIVVKDTVSNRSHTVRVSPGGIAKLL